MEISKSSVTRKRGLGGVTIGLHGSCIAGLAAVCIASGCGKEGPPLPPEIRIAERTTDLEAFQEGDVAVLRWSYPSLTTSGQNLTDIEAIEVWRTTLPKGQEPPPPMTPQDRAIQRQLLEAQGEIVRRLDPAEIEAATRGSQLVYRDDLVRWRRAMPGDPESSVVWYGVRTICCRKKESDLSNVARLLPSTPPDPPVGLELKAGAQGIALRWRPLPATFTLVERSADGTVWKRVTEEPLKGGEWRDEEAAQGRAWSYRLRTVAPLEGGGLVIGEPSEPVRIDHPDTYPPATPSEVVCLPEGSTVRIRWRLVAGAAGYEVTRRLDQEPAEVLASGLKSVEFIDTNPPLGEVVYLVVASDDVGNMSESAGCSVVMGVVP